MGRDGKKIWELIKKAAPALSVGLSIESWRLSIKDRFQDELLRKQSLQEAQKTANLTKAKELAEKKLHDLECNIFSKGSNLISLAETKNLEQERLKMETHQLIREKNPDAIMQAQGRIKNLNEKIEKIQKQEMEINKEIKDLSNIGVSSKPGQSSEILNSDDIIKAGIGGSLITFIDGYKDFISMLSTEQLAVLVSFWGHIMILNLISSLIFIVLGDELIFFLRLESKFPRLAQYIKYKQTIYKIYLKIYVSLLFLLTIILILIDIYMLTYEYMLS
jgi:hypothetical protein